MHKIQNTKIHKQKQIIKKAKKNKKPKTKNTKQIINTKKCKY